MKAIEYHPNGTVKRVEYFEPQPLVAGDVMPHETPEEKRRFYLEVAALLGNKSAANALRDLQKPVN